MLSSVTGDSARTDYLELLVTQLKNQDPLDPVQQEDFIGQLAQFATLEGIENLNTNFQELARTQQATQGADLLGRTVKYQSQQGGGQEFGVVEGVEFQDNKLILNVNGGFVPIQLVGGIYS